MATLAGSPVSPLCWSLVHHQAPSWPNWPRRVSHGRRRHPFASVPCTIASPLPDQPLPCQASLLPCQAPLPTCQARPVYPATLTGQLVGFPPPSLALTRVPCWVAPIQPPKGTTKNCLFFFELFGPKLGREVGSEKPSDFFLIFFGAFCLGFSLRKIR